MRDLRLSLIVITLLSFCPVHLAQCELAKLTASDGSAGDLLAWSVAISRDTLVAGAPSDDDSGTNSGSAYVFERSGTSWVETAKLVASDATVDDSFGRSVAISGHTIVVGSRFHSDLGLWSGAAYVFEKVGGSWVETTKLLASDGDPWEEFGSSVAVHGDVAVVGARREHDAAIGGGAAYVFERVGDAWIEVAKLSAGADSQHEGNFGAGVATDGVTIAVTAPGMDAAFVFEMAGGMWTKVAKLTSPLFFVPLSAAIDVSAGTIALQGWGMVFIFERQEAGWSFAEKLAPDGVTPNDFFGVDVAVERDLVVVGATGDDDLGRNSGASYLYQFVGSSWTLLEKFTASDTGAGDGFGGSVSLSRGTLAVSAAGNGDLKGSAYVFGLSLCGDVSEISLASGGAQVLDLDAGPGHAGELHLLLGSTSGTSPGFELAGFSAPLNPDGYFHFTLASPNTPPLTGSLGFLDASGQATATFTLPAGLPPGLAGLTVYHAFGALNPMTGSLEHVSNASAVLLVP